jgi:hypothetical protein
MLVKNIVYHEKRTKGIVGPTFHYFDYKNGECALFDSLIDQPIIFGQRNIVDSFIRKDFKSTVSDLGYLDVSIVYYKLMDDKLKFHRKLDISLGTKK